MAAPYILSHDLKSNRAMSVTDAALTSLEFAEALCAFCKDVVAAQ